eukprot:scaffold5.g658.t1
MRVAAAGLLALLLLVAASGASAKITNAMVKKDDRSLILMAEPFGFGPDGRINITISKFLFRRLGTAKEKEKPNYSRLGFFITTAEAEVQLEVDLNEGKCALDATDVTITLLTFDEIDATKGELQRGFALRELIQARRGPDYDGGEFSLFFANCEPDSAVDFKANIALYNMKGDTPDFLPVGDDVLPIIYFLMFGLFTFLGGLWIYLIAKSKEYAHKIHYVMVVLVAFKSLTVLSQAGMYHMIGVLGVPEGWNIAYYIFTALRGLLFFVVVILIAAGWSYMKPFLADREKRILLVVVPLQVMANVAIVVLDEYTPAAESWFTWRDIMHMVDIVCCCAILFPIVWSIKQLRDGAETDGKAARVLHKLTLFRQVVSYIYFTRIIVYLLESTLNYKLIWMSNLASELATLAFYIACGISFRPMPANANPYFQARSAGALVARGAWGCAGPGLTEEEAIELTRAEDP